MGIEGPLPQKETSTSLAESDYQLYEALNLLKGLVLMQDRAKG